MAEAFLPEHPAIPGYEVIRVLTRNTGIVYLARRLSSGQEVVVKVYDRRFSGRPDGHPNRSEAILANIHHPDILQVFEMGKLEGFAYIAMEHVENTLAERLRRGPSTPGESVTTILAITSALEYALSLDLVCLGLAPGSIGLTRDGVPKLFQFQPSQIARQPDGYSRLLQPEFAAPEDVTPGDVLAPAAAVYRIGAVMYAMLTGRPPFAGQVSTVIYDLLHHPPLPPSELIPNIPRGLEAVCLRCLEKQPEKRYRSLGELAHGLDV